MTGEIIEPGAAHPPAPFNYDCLDKAQASRLRKTAAHIRKTCHDNFLEIGRELVNIKEWLAHGLFAQWVECECQMGIRTAERAMQAARVVTKSDKLSSLPIDALIALEGRTVTNSILDQVASKIDAGEIPTAAEVRALIPKSTPSGNATSAAAEGATDEPEQTELPPATLDDLKALWDRADAEARNRFREHIGCGDCTAAAAD
jgi:hypothetical protein